MALTVQEVVNRAAVLLHDLTGVRWAQSELVQYLNDGRRAICVYRPDLYAVTVDVPLTQGALQNLPADGQRLLDVVCVLSATGVPLGSVRVTERTVLDHILPNWMGAPADVPKHFMYDERTPREYMVYPPAPAGTSLRIRHSKAPVDLIVTDALTVEALYENALVDYVLSRSFTKDSDFANNAERADRFYTSFLSLVRDGVTIGAAAGPNVSNRDGSPPEATKDQ